MKMATIANINVTYDLGFPICIHKMKRRFKTFERKCHKFRGGILKIKGYGCMLIDTSGKISVTGVRSKTRANKFVDYFCRRYNMPEGKIVNITASFSMDFGDDTFDKIKNLDDVSYEPELFAAAYLKLPKKYNNAKVLIFRSGKINITGCKRKKDIESVRQYVRNKILFIDFI